MECDSTWNTLFSCDKSFKSADWRAFHFRGKYRSNESVMILNEHIFWLHNSFVVYCRRRTRFHKKINQKMSKICFFLTKKWKVRWTERCNSRSIEQFSYYWTLNGQLGLHRNRIWVSLCVIVFSVGIFQWRLKSIFIMIHTVQQNLHHISNSMNRTNSSFMSCILMIIIYW